MQPPLQTGRRNGRLVAVALTEVPITIRRRLGLALLNAAADNLDIQAAIDFKRAIEFPSDRKYLVSEEARKRVLG